MDNRWSDSLRRKMEHHGETPPEGLWDALERGMDRRAEALSRRRRRMFWSVGSSAAAAVVALMLLVDLGSTADDTEGGVAADRVVDRVVDSVTSEPVALEPVVPEFVAPEPVVPQPVFPQHVVDTPRTTTEAIPEVIPEVTPEVIPDPTPDPTPEVTPDPTPLPEPRRERPDYERYFATEPPPTIRPRKVSRQGRWQTGLYASNSAMSGSRSQKELMASERSVQEISDRLNTVTSDSYFSTTSTSVTPPALISLGSVDRSVYNNVEHRLPVTVGVSVGHGLGKRWSLTGGLTYTRLASTYTNTRGFYSGSYEQVLHYIGIPLDVKMEMWRSAGGFSVYLSAGGQAAKSVAGTVRARGAAPSPGQGGSTGEGSIADPRVQWSVRGSAGIGWDFTPTVGLYAEPGVDYHFDNGSDVVTVWKDRPLNFGLRLGLRLSL